MRAISGLLLFLTVSTPFSRAEETGGVPPIPDSVPADAVRYSVLSTG